MLIVRAPMRLSFAGGGTDLPAYYREHGGMVVSTSIDKYVYVFISPNGFGSLQISSSDYSTFFRHAGGEEVEEEGKLRYARAFLRHFGVRAGYSLFMASEMPPGTGLGSSSSLSVALTKALAALRGDVLSKDDVALQASSIEIDKLKMPIGRQDHYASAFGGINAIHFGREEITVESLRVSAATRRWLEDSLMIFFTEQSHDSGQILAEQSQRSAKDPGALEALHAIRAGAEQAREALLGGAPEQLGEIMQRGWEAKRRLAKGVSNPRIDAAYEAAISAGASGGKIAGAGGGGFLLVVCPHERQAAVSAAMEQKGLVRADFHFENAGARILVNSAAN